MRTKTNDRNIGKLCDICGHPVQGSTVEYYKKLHTWIEEILTTTKEDSYFDAVSRIRNRILFPEKCVCGKKVTKESVKGYTPPLRILIDLRLKCLLQPINGKSPGDAIADCRKNIFGREIE